MDLYLIRHAEAVPVGERGITEDEERPLTKAGEAQARAVGKALAKQGITFDYVIASPLVRAQQSATILLRQLGKSAELETTNALSPSAKPRKLAKFLRSITGERIGMV